MATVFESISLVGLRLSHLRQLAAYIGSRDETGWYYGNREQFEKRHTDLMIWIDNAVKYAESEGVKLPNKTVEIDRAKCAEEHDCQVVKDTGRCVGGCRYYPPRNSL